MDSVIVPIFIGVFIVLIGILNMKGNISSIHWYHRQRVEEKNKIPFGRLVGIGTIVIGASIILFGVFSLATELFNNELYIFIGSIIVFVGIAIGLIFSLYAMIKYNKGIF